tara:strand:- start:64 stop:651 length:588 start_codon:yes stop_codon:yes gene_type:complete
MKRLLLILVLTFSFQSWTKADDIRDFEIEGMSIGDSLLDFFNKKKISDSEVDWYDSLEPNRYVSFAFKSNNFNQYEYVDAWTKYGDSKFNIIALAGVKYFGKNKTIKDINDCYTKQLEIAKEISEIFTDAKMDGPHKLSHTDDTSGNSSYTDIYFELGNDYEAVISCYDWSDKLENKPDHLYITLRSNKFESWLF